MKGDPDWTYYDEPLMEDLIELRDVRKSFGNTQIIRGVNRAVHQGERHAVIGPNGAGKSTLFRMITGAEPPDEGTITLGDSAGSA